MAARWDTSSCSKTSDIPSRDQPSKERGTINVCTLIKSAEQAYTSSSREEILGDSYLQTLEVHNRSELVCSLRLSGADSLAALGVGAEGSEALPQPDRPRTYRCFHTCRRGCSSTSRLTAAVGGKMTRRVWSLDTWKTYNIEPGCVGASKQWVGCLQGAAAAANRGEDKA